MECGGDFFAGAGDTAFRVNDDALGVDEFRAEEGDEGQEGARDIAAGIGDEAGGADGIAVALGEAVDSVVEVGEVFVGSTVGGGVDGWITEAVISGDVNDAGAAVEEGRSGGHGGAVWQGEEDEIEGGGEELVEGRDHEIAEACELGESSADGLIGGIGAMGEGGDAHEGMAREAANELAAGIACSAGDADGKGSGGHAFDFRTRCLRSLPGLKVGTRIAGILMSVSG